MSRGQAPIEDVLSAVARRDVRALGDLYDRVGEPAFRTAYLVVRDSAKAEEIVRDVFLTVWRTGGRTVERPVTAWLLKLVYQRAQASVL